MFSLLIFLKILRMHYITGQREYVGTMTAVYLIWYISCTCTFLSLSGGGGTPCVRHLGQQRYACMEYD